jgi:hypothetical protein
MPSEQEDNRADSGRNIVAVLAQDRKPQSLGNMTGDDCPGNSQ